MDGSGEAEEKAEILPSTETDAPANSDTVISDEQWKAMKDVIDNLLSHRDEDGNDPSKVFHKRVNKRNIPSYYEVIKEPMAFSNLKSNCTNREYTSFAGFVRECALIWHNAHTYNRPDAGAYQDASTIKNLMETELQKLVDQNIISAEVAAWPDLGEIPPVEEVPADEEEEEEEDGDGEGDGEDEDEDDDAEDSDEDAPRGKRRARPSGLLRRDTNKSDGAKGEQVKKRRGRPPKVDTPMEARIKNVLKGIRKPKNDSGILILHFEKLPDKTTMPDYYAEIKHPIAIEQIKKNQKRKRYNSVDHFMKDIDLMFENAKLFNEDDSQVYNAAVTLQEEAHKLAEIEKKKSDDDFVMEEGRKPRPGGITHNGELWQVGDWVHIRNSNDISKPIVAQIYRTWEDAAGQPWVNACWYYRPEQTVHQYEKHFFPGEVVKTGQYRDHPIDDVIDRCFVMFFTRFSRGRPRGIPPDREVYVCEARYNEEKHKMNKIKTWASCLPDEVRDKDYEMDMFDGVRKVKKVPSPLLYMLKDDAKDDEEPPKPRWEAENAPPALGGIYKGSRDENQSPPPEPTPSPPPPPPPPPPPRQTPQTPNPDMDAYRRASELIGQAGRPFGSATDVPPTPQQQQSSYASQQRQYSQPAASPVPAQYQQHQPQLPAQAASYTPQAAQHSAFQPPPSATYDHYATPQSNRYAPQQRYAPMTAPLPAGQRPPEVFVLPDAANASIPEDIRSQFKRDEGGRVMFFARPPLDLLPPIKPDAPLGHSLKYKAAKLRRALAEKEQKEKEETQFAERAAKRQKRIMMAEQENQADPALFEAAVGMSFDEWARQMNKSVESLHKAVYGEKWEESKKQQDQKLVLLQVEAKKSNQALEQAALKRKEGENEATRTMWQGPKVYLDDMNARY